MRKFILIILLASGIYSLFPVDINTISAELLKLKDNKSIDKWFDQNKNEIDTAFLFNIIGQAYGIWYSQGDRDNALKLCDIAIYIADKKSDPDSKAYGLYQKATIYFYIYDYKNAKICNDKSLVIFSKAGNMIGQANCFKTAGDIAFNYGDFSESSVFYNKALDIYKDMKSTQGESVIYYSLAECYYNMNDFGKAVDYYDSALKLYKSLKDEFMTANCNMKKGYAAFYTGDIKNALLLFDEAIQIYLKYGNKTGMASCYKGKADIYSAGGEYSKADTLYDVSLELYISAGEALGEANCYKYKADVALFTGNYAGARELYDRAYGIYVRIEDFIDQANCLQKLGELSTYTGDRSNAMEFLEKAMALYTRMNAANGIATTYLIMGNISRNYGEIKTAENYYNKALGIYTGSASPYGEGLAYTSLGEMFTLYGDKVKAEEYYDKAMTLFKKTGYKIGEASCYYQQAEIAILNNDFYSARELYGKALDIYKDVEYPLGIADCYSRFGDMSAIDKKYLIARKYYDDAMKIYTGLDNKMGIASSNESIGDIYFSQSGNIDKAEELYIKSMTINKDSGFMQDYARCNEKSAYMLTLKNQSEKAEKLYKESLDLYMKFNDPMSISICYNNLAYNFFIKDDVVSLKKSSENIDQAVLWLEKAREGAGGTEEKKGFFSGLSGIYSFGVEINYYLKDYEKMFYYMESSRARSLLDEISEFAVLQSSEIDRSLVTKLKDLKSRIYSTDNIISILKKDKKDVGESRKLLFNLNREYDDIFKKILLKYPKYSEMAKPEIATIKKLQGTLEEETIVEYLIESDSDIEYNALIKNDDKIGNFAFIITKNSFDIIPLQNASEPLIDIVDIYRELLISPEELYILKDGDIYRYFGKTGADEKKIDAKQALEIINKKLYSIYVKPVFDHLKNKRDIVIIPDNNLALLPFESLRDESGKYLAETAGISYIQSSSIFLKSKQLKIDSKLPFLGFGGAVYENENKLMRKNINAMTETEKRQFTGLLQSKVESAESLSSIYEKKGYYWINLPGTIDEVSGIGKLYYREGTRDYKNSIITGKSVNEDQIKKMNIEKKLKKYRIIHFATHGLADLEIPELSSLILTLSDSSNSLNNDGYLTMTEILNLDLNSELVNLSACETGLGKIVNGEGLIGLTQSFILAGAKNVDVSLWSVSDESTSIFMTRFYEKIKKGMSYKDALTETKREFIKDNVLNAPFYWAPFVLYGSN